MPCLCFSQVKVGPSFGFDMSMHRVIPNGDGFVVDRRVAPVVKAGFALNVNDVSTNLMYNWEDRVFSITTIVFLPVEFRRKRGKIKCFKWKN